MMTLFFGQGPLLEVESIPIDHRNAIFFLARTQTNGPADLFALRGHGLSIYRGAKSKEHSYIELLAKTSAIDVVDVDGDGYCELICICESRILSYPLQSSFSTDTNESIVPTELFRLKTQLSAPSPSTFPYVLVIEHGGESLLALPCENTFELRTLSGKLVESYPIGADAPRHVTYGWPFRSWSVSPAQAGPKGSLELLVRRSLAFEPHLPAGLPIRPQKVVSYASTLLQRQEASNSAPQQWPWFPLQPGQPTSERVRYALAKPDFAHTLIRMQGTASVKEGYNSKPSIRSERRYPGSIFIARENLPDFNGDGYVDLVLWDTPQPAPSLKALTAAALGGLWPLRITTHLYDPVKGSYAPKPAARINLEAPITWFFENRDSGMPLRHVVFGDFDGDGRTDFGCSSTPENYAVWCFRDGVFSSQPDFNHIFPEALEGIEFSADLKQDGTTSLGLRGSTRFFVLRAVNENVVETPKNF
jgi:hypothetical protein